MFSSKLLLQSFDVGFLRTLDGAFYFNLPITIKPGNTRKPRSVFNLYYFITPDTSPLLSENFIVPQMQVLRKISPSVYIRKIPNICAIDQNSQNDGKSMLDV